MTRPKGYRQITVKGRVWYWMPTNDLGVIARAADTGERAHISGRALSALVPGCPERVEIPDDWETSATSVVMPQHVAAWLGSPWQPVRASSKGRQGDPVTVDQIVTIPAKAKVGKSSLFIAPPRLGA